MEDLSVRQNERAHHAHRPHLTAQFFVDDFDPERQYWVLGAIRRLRDGSSGWVWRTFYGANKASQIEEWLRECAAEGATAWLLLPDVRHPIEREPQDEDITGFRFIAARSSACDGFLADGGAYPHAVYSDASGEFTSVWKLSNATDIEQAKDLSRRNAAALCKGRFAAMPRLYHIPLPPSPFAAGAPGFPGYMLRKPSRGVTSIPVSARKKQGQQAAFPSLRPVAADPRAAQLVRVLGNMGFAGRIKEVKAGPVITQYVFVPDSGTQEAKIIGRASDIARELEAQACSIVSQPGGLAIQIPNAKREIVGFREVLDASRERDKGYALPVALGKTAFGVVVDFDLSKAPHLLVAGASGGGKSVGLNTIILSLLHSLTPAQCKFVMVDPKELELAPYEQIPHLARPVATDVDQGTEVMAWAVEEMQARYKLMKQIVGCRSLADYNKRRPDETLPYIVCVVDEYADILMMDEKKRFADLVKRIAQKGRAAGISLIVATQRPSVDVITGVIKANFLSRIAFQVVSGMDSKVILDQIGAEQLLGNGDALFMDCGRTPYRVHVSYANDEDLTEIIASVKEKYGTADFGDDADFVSDDESLPNVFDATPMGGGEREAVEGEEDEPAPSGAPEKDAKIKRAVQWLLDRLNGEPPTLSTDLQAQGKRANPPIADRTMRRAAERLAALGKLKKTGPGPNGEWVLGQAELWSLI